MTTSAAAPPASTAAGFRGNDKLLLGIVLRDRDDDRAEDLLRRFLAVAPEHPAAPEVSAQLGSPEGE